MQDTLQMSQDTKAPSESTAAGRITAPVAITIYQVNLNSPFELAT